MPEYHAELVLPVGILYCRRDHREWWRGGACEEPHLRGVRLLHDQLYLPGCGRMDMGLRLAGLSAGRGLPGLCERQCKQLQTSCSIVNLSEDVSAANPNPKPKA